MTPLEDPKYVPEHPPEGGYIPSVVEKWGPATQLRWFRRFRGQLKPMRAEVWARYHCASVTHKGLCCISCIEDVNEGYELYDATLCCCRGIREVGRA